MSYNESKHGLNTQNDLILGILKNHLVVYSL